MGNAKLKIYFDGGARPNPGPIEVAVVIRGVAHVFEGIGLGTNSDAEWQALICALRLAQADGAANYELIGDAAHIIAQANGTQKCRDTASKAHFEAFKELAAANAPARIRWIKRQQNLAGIALAQRHER